MIQYLYRDEPQLSRFQTGLVFVDDHWKPSLQAFRLPFAQMGRRGLQAIVWGQVRDGKDGRKRYRLEVLRKNTWKPVGRARLTNDEGVFMRTIRVQARRPLPDLVAGPAALQPAAADQVSRPGAVHPRWAAIGTSAPPACATAHSSAKSATASHPSAAHVQWSRPSNSWYSVIVSPL